MQTKEHNDHDQMFSFEPQYMGEIHINMNGGSSAILGDQRRANHVTTVQAKVIDSTKLTERTSQIVKSHNTTNAMSSSMVGKVLYERIK